MESLRSLSRRINKKWNKVDSSLYWGDRLDIRYYLCWTLQFIKNKKVLDIGCGPGIILSELDKSNNTFGIDISEKNIKIARNVDKNGKFVVADMLYLPFKEQSFDVIMLNAMLPLAPNKEKLIESIYSLLKDKGIFFIITHNRNHHSYKNDKSILSFEEINNLLHKHFNCKIMGFNPFPRFPFFLPNTLVDKIPFIWQIILFFAKCNIFSKISRGIFVKAVKNR